MTQINASVPLLGFAAFSGTGKTTLIEAMLPKLVEQGLRVAVIKHAHHDFDLDEPGKDSYRLRKAGASQMLISSRYRRALINETPTTEATLAYLIRQLDQTHLDLILVEGFKNLDFPKIELHRQAINKPWLFQNDNNIIAVASDIKADTSLPQISIDDIEQLTNFVVKYSSKSQQQSIKTASCDEVQPQGMLSVEQGRQRILAQIKTIDNPQTVELKQALGRIVHTDILSPVNVPQHTNSAMDGYAIRGADIDLNSYTVVGQVLAGHHYPHPLQAGEAVRIMTGAPVPQAADTVIMREQAHQNGDTVTFNLAMGAIKAGQNVRLAGEDLAIDQVTVAKGQTITAPELGMVASLGLNEITINTPLRLAIFSTGDEVQAPGEAQRQNCIYDSNRYSLFALLTRLGCEVVDLGIIEDSEATLEATLNQASQQADMILSSGGVSVGDADYIKTVLDKLGKINFWRINMRPGRPLAFGHINDIPFFGLPGNPVAVMVTFLQFVEPAIRKQQGYQDWQPQTYTAIAAEPLRSRIGRTEYLRGYYKWDANGRLSVKTIGSQGSGILRSMSEANCLIEISPQQEYAQIGDKVTVIPLDIRL
ncbi:bifunctional molybdopterin-guanine dinucleotide biosynthesis adaptor protein MobB/molybdopterin molybdotransferase MoeA [uncultured Photobacterium sp.]|uniref:bifunctional molybdopterin-guanine dinucleotide biosynthesis adaptor protein MobB/molybdopterin molybdotransferase MoeA n=1 Tax=uncultured Photobacterium sp. TaxID=173973 RepID=UPI00261CC076|nr:bifunctional molybdopterin-guanine dinucleotide biosynthesis adaptor protein MobB/molybdopterin molybdotransferase MoeA [uncultured Photobacterium sp.]